MKQPQSDYLKPSTAADIDRKYSADFEIHPALVLHGRKAAEYKIQLNSDNKPTLDALFNLALLLLLPIIFLQMVNSQFNPNSQPAAPAAPTPTAALVAEVAEVDQVAAIETPPTPAPDVPPIYATNDQRLYETTAPPPPPDTIDAVLSLLIITITGAIIILFVVVIYLIFSPNKRFRIGMKSG